jgi:hypothetical protein
MDCSGSLYIPARTGAQKVYLIKPRELPIEMPNKFRPALNLKTATIDRISRELLVQAHQVVQ